MRAPIRATRTERDVWFCVVEKRKKKSEEEAVVVITKTKKSLEYLRSLHVWRVYHIKYSHRRGGGMLTRKQQEGHQSGHTSV